VHYSIYKSLVCILSHINPVHNQLSYFFMLLYLFIYDLFYEVISSSESNNDTAIMSVFIWINFENHKYTPLW
jgi:hypothetical protein